jgi:hypothetical protein
MLKSMVLWLQLSILYQIRQDFSKMNIPFCSGIKSFNTLRLLTFIHLLLSIKVHA